MTWTVDNSGSQTATVGTEHTLDTPTTNGTYVLWVDTNAMANGDTAVLRCYYEVDGTNQRLAWEHWLSNIQALPAIPSPPLACSNTAKFTLQQTAGTGRAFPWQVLRI